MNLIQIALLFSIWIAFGFFLKTKSDFIRERLLAQSRSFRIGLGIFGFIFAAGFLFAGLVAASKSPMLYAGGNLSIAGFIVVCLAGIGFVLLQVVAASSAVLIAIENVTTSGSQTSPLQQNKLNKDSTEITAGEPSPEPDTLKK